MMVASVNVRVLLIIRFWLPLARHLRVNFVQYTPKMLITLNRSTDENAQNGNMYGFHTELDAFYEQRQILVVCNVPHCMAASVSS